jgi:hypothetical protein
MPVTVGGDLVGLGRWELLRALGAVTADQAAAGELGLPPVGETGHDEVFTVNCPPFASLYLGGPAEPDHLAGLLDRYRAPTPWHRCASRDP